MNDGFVLLHKPPKENLAASWRRCLQNCEFACHYTAPEYFDEPFLRGKDPFAVLALAGGEVAAVLTGYHENKHVRCGLAVRPQVVLSVSYENSDRIGSALIEGVLQEGRSSDLIDVYAWSPLPVLATDHFKPQKTEGVVLLDLTNSPDSLFRRFSDNKKTNIKKAIKNDVIVEITRRKEDIHTYYEITRNWARRKEISPPEKEAFVESLTACQYRHLFVARHSGAIVAGVVVRGYPGGVLEYAANSSLPEFLSLRPNDLLHWRAIEWAYHEGFKKYSLGGTHLFLRKFGGPMIPTYRYRFDNTAFRVYLARDFLGELIAAGKRRLAGPINVLNKGMRDRRRRRGKLIQQP